MCLWIVLFTVSSFRSSTSFSLKCVWWACFNLSSSMLTMGLWSALISAPGYIFTLTFWIFCSQGRHLFFFHDMVEFLFYGDFYVYNVVGANLKNIFVITNCSFVINFLLQILVYQIHFHTELYLRDHYLLVLSHLYHENLKQISTRIFIVVASRCVQHPTAVD